MDGTDRFGMLAFCSGWGSPICRHLSQIGVFIGPRAPSAARTLWTFGNSFVSATNGGRLFTASLDLC